LKQRIQTLDGLRFLAALGVLWIHAWTSFGNPRCYVGKFDLTNILAIGGNGVDLFFVISGFCMYYFYAANTQFSYTDFSRFIYKRWIRLSPAFYTATVVYLLVEVFMYGYKTDGLRYFLNSIFYLNSIFPQYNAASHFWTLGAEWQFYLIIPFLLIYQNKIGFKKAYLIIFGMLIFIAILSVLMLKVRFHLFANQIFFRGIEFGAGILAARLLILNITLFKNRICWFIIFLIITYAGRVLISKQMLTLYTDYYNLLRLMGFSLMGCGFSGILYLSVTSGKWLNLILGNQLFKTMGRISYSFYLWHGLVLQIIAGYIMQFAPISKGIIAPVIATCVSLIILYPISMLSYAMLEKPFLSVGNLTRK
jgi:peptidoglycan/LPS O-acetylase OafA/YrhL